METVTTTRMPGWVQTKFNDFATDDILPSSAVDRLQEDDNLLSRAIVELHRLYHYPLIVTAAHTMPVTVSADTVTLADGVLFSVGGMVFDTHDLDARAVAIPDNATRFLRAEIDDGCGLVVDYGDPANGNIIDPLARKLVCRLSLVEGAETDAEGAGGGRSSPTSLRLLKAVKGEAGATPVVTLYANDGHDPGVTTVAEHEVADPAHAASHILFDNAVSALSGDPIRVQAAIEALAAGLDALTSHTAGYIPVSEKGAADGVATLDDSEHVPAAQLPRASAAQAAAGTDESTVLTPAALRSGVNASGAAPVYACRAWVQFDGTATAPAIRASGNVSGVARNGTGDYTITFAEPMPDAGYAVVITGARSGAITGCVYDSGTAQTAAAVRILMVNSEVNVFDTAYVSVAVFR